MAIVFVFTDEEDARAKELGVNIMKLKDTTDEALFKMLDDPFFSIFMPFFKDKKEREEIVTSFHNQVIMRKIWKGD